MSAIEISGLSFGYSKNTLALNNVSLSIKENTTTVILGKNGCGKSTLIDCIIGYRDYQNGIITIDGKNAKELSQIKKAREMAYISQNTVINMDYTVLDFIVLGRTCHIPLLNSPKKEDYEIAMFNAKKCKIEHLLDKDINKLSGGERQLAFIARALTQESPIIVMDEPISALDVSNQHHILTELKRIAAEETKTIIISSHNPNHALFLDSNVVLMQEGKIVEHGNAKDLLCVERLKDIYGDCVCYSDEHNYREISFITEK